MSSVRIWTVISTFLGAMFTALRVRTAGFCFAKSSVVEMHKATFRQDALSRLKHLNGSLLVLASVTLIKTSSDPFSPGHVQPLSGRSI